MEDLVSEIEQMSQIGKHPSVVGFVGANIASDSADPIILLEYLDGGCLQDAMDEKSKYGGPWRPPKETSSSWCALTPIHSIHSSHTTTCTHHTHAHTHRVTHSHTHTQDTHACVLRRATEAQHAHSYLARLTHPRRLAHKKCPPPLNHRRALGTVLL